MGFSLALGGLPRPLLHGQAGVVLENLGLCIVDQEVDTKFTESKRDAVYAVTNIATKMNISSLESCDQSCDQSCDLFPENVSGVFEMLFTGMANYSTDGRGDIGALVREASIQGLRDVLLKITDSGHTKLITPQV